MQTPTPPQTKRFAERAASVCSQRYPGSVKSGLSSTHWKARCDDDDIPSDESDHGGKRPFGPNMRTRIRKRRALSVMKPGPRPPTSMSWMSTSKCMRTESVCIPSSSCSNVTTEKNVKKALFPTSSNPNKSPTQVRPGPSGLHGTKSFSVHANLGQQRGGTSLKSPPRASKEIVRRGSSSNPDPPAAHKPSLPVDWVLYSIWHPAWDVIWKCDNGKRPLSQNQYFRKLITEVLAVNTTPRDISETIDLKVIKVKGFKEDSQGKLSIIGALEVEARRRPHQKKKKYIKWNPAPDLLGRLLKYVVSVSDLIVQYKCPTTLENGNSKGKLCFIHITPKDGQPVDYFELSKMGAQVAAYNVNYDYYKPKVIKCVPFKLTRTKTTTTKAQEPIVVEIPSTVTAVDEAKIAARKFADLIFGSPGPSPISPQPLSGTIPHVVNITDEDQYQEPVDVGNEIIVAQPLSPLSEQIEEMETSDMEELDVSHNPLPSGRAPVNEQNADNDFNLTSFLTSGQFVPGPLRPKVEKADKHYVYNTLEELAEELNQSIAEDVAKGAKPNMLIKHQCNTYGIVVEIKNQIRHENAYYVRISDETMDSVLLRVHTGVNQSSGPPIKLGNIIRVHRLTVQMEWDTGVSENTMVLSTAAHHNYVLFEQSNEQFQFYYNTCAKTVTLSDFDMRRVGELHMYKSQLNIPSNEELPLPAEQEVIAPVALHEPPEVELVFERDSILVVPQSSLNDSDGICGSDLASPYGSDVSIGEDDTRSDLELILNESRIQAISNSRSDESFFSATSDLDPAGENDSDRPQTRFRKPAATSLNLNSVKPTNSSQNITFTLFKDLKMMNEPLNLLCQIVTLNEHREGIWCLILKDMEETVPSGDFKQPQSPVANPSGSQLAVNIKNGIGLEKRDLLSMLLESQGTDEFYFIPNVMVKGTQSPYTLEIDGNSCEIRRYKHLIRYLEMDDTFSITSAPSSSANPHEGAPSITFPGLDDVMDEQHQMLEIEDVNSGGVVTVTDSRVNNATASDEDSDDDIVMIEEIVIQRGPRVGSSQSGSDFVTASHTPSHSPAKIKIDRQVSPMRVGTPAVAIQSGSHSSNQVIHDVPEESWTGRLRGRRKPREHYQPEDSFEC